MKLRSLIAFLLLFTCTASVYATTYYVRAGGNDAHAGTSLARAWASLAPVNATRFLPGDSILFEGGSSFSGSISFGAEVKGSSDRPIVISSYGRGRAIISSGDSHGIQVYNSAGFVISRLVFKGAGRTANSAAGIDFYMDLPERRLTYVHLDSVEVMGYKKSGIQIGSWRGSSGFDRVIITHADIHDNGEAGISSYAEATLGHKDFYIAYSKAYNNSGLPERTDHHSGSGIVLGGVDGALIEYCEAYNNGWLNAWRGGGPVGIWGYHCNNLIIQYNESHHNKSGTAKDGGGFDIDGGCTNCTIQYNYSHDNHGPGYLIAQYPNAPTMKGVVVRYNISENDARTGSYGAIHLWSSGANGGIQEAEIYNNTVYVTPSATGSPKAVYVQSGGVRKANIRNNILQTTGGLDLVYIDRLTDVRFEGNIYWTSGGASRFYWAGTSYATLSRWREATTQETLSGAPTGLFQDPQLKDPGKGITLGNPALLYTLSGYQLKIGSELAGEALNLHGLFSIDAGKTDFWGNSLQLRNDLCPGAHQLTAGSKACLDGGIIQLPTGASEAGLYTGVGVMEDNYFDPQAAGLGVHNLQYTYTDAQGQLQLQPYTLRVVKAGLTEWLGQQTKGDDWFDSENWSSCVPTALIDAMVPVNQDPVQREAAGAVPRIRNGNPAQVKDLSTSDTLSLAGDGTLEISGFYHGKGMEAEDDATVVFKSREGQQVPAGEYGRLVLQGTGSRSIAGPVRVSRELDMGEGMLYLGNHHLKLEKEGRIINASASSYVVTDGSGALVREGVGNGQSMLYPVGTAGSYTPAYLSNAGVEDNFSIRVTEGIQADGTSGAFFESGNVNRTWHVEEKVRGGSEVSLKLQWNVADEQAAFYSTEGYVSHYENNSWSRAGLDNEHAREVGTGLYQASLHRISSFSPFAVRDRSVVLPVTFSAFEVRHEDSAVVLYWETADEKNNKGFYVEVSEDGAHFRTLGFVASKSTTSSQLQRYTYRDTPSAKRGSLYYRLRQQDIDGTTSYSAVKAVYFGEGSLRLKANPNPFGQELQLEVTAVAEGQLEVRLTDMMGRVVYSSSFQLQKGQNQLVLTSGSDLSPGIYLLTASTGGIHHQLRVIKR